MIFHRHPPIRNFHFFSTDPFPGFKARLLHWVTEHCTCLFLDHNGFLKPEAGFDCLAAAGALDQVEAAPGKAFVLLKEFQDRVGDWTFGHFSYDLKNELEDLASHHFDGIGLPDLHWFQPEVVIRLRGREAGIGIPGDYGEAARIFREICNCPAVVIPSILPGTRFASRMTDSDYLDRVRAIREYIHAGDCYELNFCRESFCGDLSLSPVSLFAGLNQISPAPFAACYRAGDRWLACASPERYLKKSGSRIWSQPIKGTAARGRDGGEDDRSQVALSSSLKERAENIMTVDLVRNDLSRIAARNTVEVEELCRVEPFAQVFQMISTVTCSIREGLHPVDAVAGSFPMGSMTGAPKVRVMQLIEELETSRRGLYSGAVGYFDPQGNFDLNVVIRSILYNAASRYLSFHTGSAITFRSDPGQELLECQLKGAALRQAVSGSRWDP